VVWLVYKKELRETLRDRRTLIVMVLLPLALYPLVGVGVSQWVGAQQAAREEQPSRVGVAGRPWPSLEAALRAKTIRTAPAAAGTARDRALRDGSLDLVLTVPEGAEARLAAEGTVELGLLYDETRDSSSLARQRVLDLLARLERQIRSERLRARSLPPSLVAPLRTVERSTARPREVGAHLLSGVLPMLVVLMVLLGAFYPAIDLTAGEKERGTLETLFTTPAPRGALVAGKFLTVATIATLTGVLNLGSIGLTVALGFGSALRAAGITSSLVPWSALALTAVALIPSALFFAALTVAVAAVARSFKEAQNLLTPVYLVCVLPAMVAQLPGFSLTPLTALIPVVNVALLARDLISGRVQLLPAGVALLATLGYALVALRIASLIWRSERMLFAPERSRGGERRSPRRSYPQPAEAAFLLLAVMALILLVGNPLQARGLVSGILITEWGLIALPVIALLRLGRLDASTAIGLRGASPRALLGALLAGLSAWYLVGVLVESVQQRLLPIPRELLEEIKRTLFTGSRPLAVDLFALALSPAICEELLFRGVLLRASWRADASGGEARPGLLRTPSAVVLNGLLFALFHLSIYRFLPTFILGAVLAFCAIRSGSILPSMLFHLLNNGAAILVGRHAAGASLEGAGLGSSFSLTAAAGSLTLFSVGLVLLWRSGTAVNGRLRSTPGAPPGP
jgi:sodium transport system permease protein